MHRLLLLAGIKGSKVYFGKLVTFLGGGSTYPLEGVFRGKLQKKFQGGVSPNFRSGGGRGV